MPIKYTDGSYAHSRMSGTICMKDGKPIEITKISPSGTVSYYFLGVENFVDSCHMSEIDVEPPELGYTVQHRFSVYSMRVPLRRMKQGLDQSAVKFITNPKEKSISKISIKSRPFLDCLKGIYPNVERAVEQVYNGERVSCALSRHFCLSNPEGNPGRDNLPLVFKGRLIVGGVNVKTLTPVLKPSFQYLSEQMEGAF